MEFLFHSLPPLAVLIATALGGSVVVTRHTSLTRQARDANRLRLDDLARLASTPGPTRDALHEHAETMQQRVVQHVAALRRVQLVLVSLAFAFACGAAGLVCAALPALGVALPSVVTAAAWMAGLLYLAVAVGLGLSELARSARQVVQEHERLEHLAAKASWQQRPGSDAVDTPSTRVVTGTASGRRAG